jgi:DNA ligase-1
MLAGKAPEDLFTIKYPVITSPKIDGIRCVIHEGKALSRNLKPIPNKYIRSVLEKYCSDGLDGEIVTYKDGWVRPFNGISSAVMSREGKPDFCFCVFDCFTVGGGFSDRFKHVNRIIKHLKTRGQTINGSVDYVAHTLVHSVNGLKEAEEDALTLGYEGLMIRAPDGKYKQGRSTTKEGLLLKLKRFEDSEAMILDVLEQQENQNEAAPDELGRSKRTSHKAGKVGKNTLGKFLVKDLKTGVVFHIGTGKGLTAALRKEIWKNPNRYCNKVIKYQHQKHGTKDKPRLPVFIGFRDEKDM